MHLPTYHHQLSAFQWRVNKISMTSSSWDLLKKIIFKRSHSTKVPQYTENFFPRKLVTAMLFVENASKHYYVTNKIMKIWYLFDIVFLLPGYVFCYIKTSIFLSIFYCFYIDFTSFSKNADVSIFWKIDLETQKLFSLVNFLNIWILLYKTWG